MSDMRIVVLGAGGLIGHKLVQRLTPRFGSVIGVLHGTKDRFAPAGIFTDDNTIENVDVRDFAQLKGVLHALDPHVILNCAGLTKRRPEVKDPLTAIEVNALFPHRLARYAKETERRVIHFSTDCVFDGSSGPYSEDSPTTPIDAYGRTKALGEIDYDHTLTIRSSFIGRELAVHSELLDWLLAQEGKTIKGFSDAWYSGISTETMARVVGDIIEHHPEVSGLRQLATEEPISKYDLLCQMRDSFGVDVEIVPDDKVSIRPTLDGSRLKSQIAPQLPSWPQMMDELAAEQSPYAHITLGG